MSALAQVSHSYQTVRWPFDSFLMARSIEITKAKVQGAYEHHSMGWECLRAINYSHFLSLNWWRSFLEWMRRGGFCRSWTLSNMKCISPHLMNWALALKNFLLVYISCHETSDLYWCNRQHGYLSGIITLISRRTFKHPPLLPTNSPSKSPAIILLLCRIDTVMQSMLHWPLQRIALAKSSFTSWVVSVLHHC